LDDLQEVGRLQFRARFKPGTDESHQAFVTDTDSRETYETFEACLAEGVRTRKVEQEVPDRVQELHEKSLTQGRDILKAADEKEKKRWLTKSGEDWSGAFGHDPKAYMDTKGNKRREPGVEDPLHDPYHPSDNEANDDDGYGSSDSSSDLGIQDADNAGNAENMNGGPANTRDSSTTGRTNDTNNTNEDLSQQSTQSIKSANKQNKRTEERKQRGLMQWKPARNAKFAKDQGKLGLSKLKKKITGGLEGRQPGVETGMWKSIPCVLCWEAACANLCCRNWILGSRTNLIGL
jgi:hypothetical protein